MIYEIGSRIISAREAKGLSAKELADIIGILPTRLNNWERGHNRPMADQITLLSNALDVSSDYLLCLTDDMHMRSGGSEAPNTITPESGGYKITETTKAIVATFVELNDHGHKALLSYANYLLTQDEFRKGGTENFEDVNLQAG